MAEITVNKQVITVNDDITILEALKKIGISVPTLCHLDGCATYTSCMVCVVKDNSTGKLFTACSTPVGDGMSLETDTEEVRTARREALELILSEHLGDCEAPCRLICPAYLDAPKMIHQIQAKQFHEAYQTLKQNIAFPAIISRICHAPCEKGCRRKRHDDAVSICGLERFVTDWAMAQETPWQPAYKSSSGKRVAIVGAGPTGLAAAGYLLQEGHECTIFEQESQPGGKLRTEVLDKKKITSLLMDDIDVLQQHGLKINYNATIGQVGGISIEILREQFNAVIIAIGQIDPATAVERYGLAVEDKGFQVKYKSFLTSHEGVFAGGDAVVPLKQAIRAMADGKSLADNVSDYLNGTHKPELTNDFNCRFGGLQPGDLDVFMKEASTEPRNNKNCRELAPGYTNEEATQEAGRCLHCDCRKSDNCKLRNYATDYKAEQHAFKSKNRGRFSKNTSHDKIIYEPGKCIKCGLCVRVTATYSDEPGLAFFGRGFDTTVIVPFMEKLSTGIIAATEECINACPTGALAWSGQRIGTEKSQF